MKLLATLFALIFCFNVNSHAENSFDYLKKNIPFELEKYRSLNSKSHAISIQIKHEENKAEQLSMKSNESDTVLFDFAILYVVYASGFKEKNKAPMGFILNSYKHTDWLFEKYHIDKTSPQMAEEISSVLKKLKQEHSISCTPVVWVNNEKIMNIMDNDKQFEEILETKNIEKNCKWIEGYLKMKL